MINREFLKLNKQLESYNNFKDNKEIVFKLFFIFYYIFFQKASEQA